MLRPCMAIGKVVHFPGMAVGKVAFFQGIVIGEVVLETFCRCLF